MSVEPKTNKAEKPKQSQFSTVEFVINPNVSGFETLSDDDDFIDQKLAQRMNTKIHTPLVLQRQKKEQQEFIDEEATFKPKINLLDDEKRQKIREMTV